jgi:hypothetical protein
MSKTAQINQVLHSYFEVNKSVKIIPAKDMMPYFILAGVFEKNNKNGKPIRDILRKLDANNQLHLIPHVYAERKVVNTSWFFQRNTSTASSKMQTIESKLKSTKSTEPKINSRKDSDEHYVLDLCDDILKMKGLRQHRFDFLVGDSGTKLPVDMYYPDLNLVIEYKEQQHTKPNKHFDKPDKLTVSGVHRGEQRKIYDQRRLDVLPQHGIKIVEISYSDFDFDRKDKIIRELERDLEVLEKFLE